MPELVPGRDGPGIDAWLGKLAHDLRNQLAPVRTATQMLQLGRVDPERQREMLDLIERQVQRMVRMLDDVNELGRWRAGSLPVPESHHDLSMLLDVALGECARHFAAAGLVLEDHVPQQRLPVRADRERLVRTLLRLFDNARRFTPAGGRVSVRIEPRGDRVALRITDTGVGMSPEVIDSLFSLPRERRDSEGLGISLLLARACIEDHGGRLSARSAGRGQGSEFVLDLPLASDSA